MIRPLTTTMAASGTLYTYPENFRAFKVLISAQYSGSKVNVDSNFVFGETNKSEAFLKKFPLGKVPAFETSDGKCIFESNAISWAVANEQLRGKSAMDQAQIVSWMNFADNEILPASCTWVFPCLGIMQFNKGNSERAKEDVKKALGALNTHLLPRTFLVGERISLADISVCCTLLHLYQYVLEPAFRKPFQNVNRWFTTMINQPQVKAIIGDFKLCEKMAQFDNKKFAEVQGKMKQGGGGEKEKKPKKEQPKKEQPKKEKEPAAEPPAPKPRDPLDALPVGNFNMDDFKRFYSNNDEDKSVPYFWEKFDPEHYSIWYCEYKYAEELSKIFMTCNLVSGMFQRVDKLRKNAFASMCIFGEDGNNNVSGIWFWRGQDLVFPLCEDWTVDYESYDWRKLDPNAEETKKLVDQYFKWIGEDRKGRKFSDGKIFK
ncbi:elongation factor 1-gamma-like isoform X4 [Homarus americanus]|uniref:elongation factor 1-gamma-like isoform X4 n=1 Tax=Homarus americanus TaxID=6706 RepID=UPI001C4864BC|nr:elongation factor 1-gamma-like isoform X4 [Homarus americanus]